MEEFKRLPWHVLDVGTDMEDVYAVNMTEYKNRNPTDVFFCNLMECEPLHLKNVQTKNTNEDSEAVKTAPKQFIDPRTGVEIPSHECNYKIKDLSARNIFLRKHIHDSKLRKHEHSACLNVLRYLEKPAAEVSLAEKKDRILFESTAAHRLEEKNLFLEKLKENFDRFNRFHEVPPAINHFVMENWKRRLITMYRQLANIKYRIRTAISQQPPECTVKTEMIHRENFGNVPIITRENVEYFRQSSSNLTNAYHLRKNKIVVPAFKEMVEKLVQEHGIDFVIPISVVKLLVSSKRGWSICMNVKDSAQSTVFNPRKEILFEKPLPKSYLSGNERHNNGAKYLIHSCLNRNPLHVFNHTEQIEKSTAIITEDMECDSKATDDIEYKISTSEEFMKNHSKIETSYANKTFSIFNVNGYDNTEDESETFKILVPTKQAAYQKNDNGKIQFLNYSPKIEFQCEYGAEVMRKDELICEWCDLYFRPDTITERVRIDCQTGKVILRQSINLTQVEDELKIKYRTETNQLLQRLWHAFQTFSAFPNGNYLLQSDSKQLNCIKIYEKCHDNGESAGISEIIKNVSFNQNLFDKVVWQPIDDEIVTELHEKYQILPCAFPHAEYLKENKVQRPKDNNIKYSKVNDTKQARLKKICPIDDMQEFIQKIQTINQDKEKQTKARINAKKQHKKTESRARKNARLEAFNAEVREIKFAKESLMNTMDEYKSVTGDPIHQPKTTMASSSITTKTRTQSNYMDSTEKTQNLRRSDRAPMNR